MVSSAHIFFAGVGTTFGILAIGFGGGVLMANSTLQGEVAQKRIVSEPPPGLRVIQPPSAQPALITAAAPVEAPATTPEQQAPPQAIPNRMQTQEKDKQAERAEQRKLELAERERRKKNAERKARRDAARAKQQQQQQQQEARQPGILAFDGDGQPTSGGLFRN